MPGSPASSSPNRAVPFLTRLHIPAVDLCNQTDPRARLPTRGRDDWRCSWAVRAARTAASGPCGEACPGGPASARSWASSWWCSAAPCCSAPEPSSPATRARSARPTSSATRPPAPTRRRATSRARSTSCSSASTRVRRRPGRWPTRSWCCTCPPPWTGVISSRSRATCGWTSRPSPRPTTRAATTGSTPPCRTAATCRGRTPAPRRASNCSP